MKKIVQYAMLCLFFVLIACGLAACSPEEQPLEPQQLSAPANLRLQNDILLWDEVEQAQGYIIAYEDTQEQTYRNYYELPYFDHSVALTFRVKAVGSGLDYIDSDWSEYDYVYEQPNQNLTYTLLPDLSGYEVTRAYSDFTGLEGRVVIPDYYNNLPVKRIASYAFYISSLSGAVYNRVTTSFRLPAYLESIGEAAFRYCSAVTQFELPESVVEIGNGAFMGCLSLREINLPSGLTELNDGVLRESGISHIDLPSVTSIGMTCFYGCQKLLQIEIPDSVVEIGDGAFSDCVLLSEVVIPDSVTVFGDSVFAGCSFLEKITMSENIKYIGDGVFSSTAWYNSQPEVYVIFNDYILYEYRGDMPQGTVIDQLPSGITCIAGGAFSGCEWLAGITLSDEIQSVGPRAFYRTSLEEFIFPSGVQKVSYSVLSNCSVLKKVVFPEGMKKIGQYAFYNCSALEEIILPSTIEEIDDHAFSNCDSVVSIIFPNTLTIIGEYAFSADDKLERVVLPASLTYLDSFAFYLCDNLKAIYFEGTEAEWEGLYYNLSLRSPQATLYFYSEEQPSEEGNFWHYVDGVAVAW